MPEIHYNVKEAARLLGWSERTVRRRIHAGIIVARKYGPNMIRISSVEIIRIQREAERVVRGV